MTKVPVTFRLSSDNREGVERVAGEEGCTRSEVIRIAVDEFTGRTASLEERKATRERILDELRSLPEADLKNILRELKQ